MTRPGKEDHSDIKTHSSFCFLSGYAAVGLDSAPSYGHTPSHHTPQLSSLSFKHEDTLSPQSNMGNYLHPDIFSLNWLADWKTIMSQQGYVSNPSFFKSQQNYYYPFSLTVSLWEAHMRT